ncbi:dipeptide/oligopeptide/nickel ABC transporter ATP-binding protein [Halobiforma lacisalsi AJ5]|uniref:Nickel import system ATP-binding protein NikD n=1 Tax=Natronobacterium lacisalsi AJ5 TaxID=358396 RepID=M0LQH9_NATLA|nr:oligopeptide/dipeptide ABC transporter ATP-binding protein [Halobiforma lacisalsi]APW96990.1 dipeptide/oligopeptide/nickel ABC transporter ATP-binding protein [Halobiforma lacisalsi AJ5]EMA34704.1 oligopeptide/dipeptide ABC transporter ATPase [Halobiforma lacisalsi AJ5]
MSMEDPIETTNDDASTATTSDSSSEPIVTVRNLQTAFFTEKEVIRAVDGVSFEIEVGETVGIVGESGSGKSVTARSIMGLIDDPGRILDGSSIRYHHPETVENYAEEYPGHTVDLAAAREEFDPADLLEDPTLDASAAEFADPGEPVPSADEIDVADVIDAGYGEELGLVDEDDFVFVDRSSADREDNYVDVTRTSGESLRKLRGGNIAMVFQDPLTSLNPVYTVGNQIKEALRLHQGITGKEATEEAIELLESVGIPDAPQRVSEYPHQFSGGMRQRAVIAMALACDPELLICDEPTTALDVTIQAQILELLEDLQEERDLAIMFITHDMGVIAEISDRVNVMYAGEVIESADVETLFADPSHPYTQGLLESIPGRQVGADRLSTIEGDVPTPNEPATYCRFAPRCPKAFEACDRVHPESVPVDDGAEDHRVSCLLYPESESEADRIALHDRLGDPESDPDGAGDATEGGESR